MKLSTRRDIAAPQEHVWAQVTDFARFERAATKQGAPFARVDDGSGGLSGARWQGQFAYGGKTRRLSAQMADWQPPMAYRIDGVTEGLSVVLTIEAIALDAGRTRLILGTELRPASLPARLLIQGLKLGKSTAEARLGARVARWAEGIEAGYLSRA